MLPLAFEKYEGLGNDFVVVDAERDDVLSREAVSRLCDRRFGIGADGVLLIVPPSTPGARARMRVLNADGSIPEMCGNGLRCAVLHVARTEGRTSGEIVMDTDAGLRRSTLDDAQGEGIVTVDMGVVRWTGDVRLEVDGEPWELALADAGNPHAITVQAASPSTIDRAGPRLATHPQFPAGTNVEFVAYRDGAADVVVWERGVGRTLACGTGACAVVAVGVAKGWLRRGEPVTVNLPGGALAISLGADDRAIMRGPARHVFSGRLPERWLESVRTGSSGDEARGGR